MAEIVKQNSISKFLNKCKVPFTINFSNLKEIDNYIGIILPSEETCFYPQKTSSFDFFFEGHYMVVFRVYLKSDNDFEYMLQFTFDEDKECVDTLLCCKVLELKIQNQHACTSKINLNQFISEMNIEYSSTVRYPLQIKEIFSTINKKVKTLYFYERDLSGGHEEMADMVEYLIVEEMKKKQVVYLAIPLQLSDIEFDFIKKVEED